MESILKKYIAEIRISPAVEFKLRSKHGLTGQKVREEIQSQRPISARWIIDSIHGKRLQVKNKINKNQILVVFLHPDHIHSEVWHLATAWVEKEKNK